MAKYNGHRSWNAWNIALWIGSDEGLYNMAKDCIREMKTREQAARRMLSYLDGQKTPDGAIYNKTCILEAMRGL